MSADMEANLERRRVLVGEMYDSLYKPWRIRRWWRAYRECNELRREFAAWREGRGGAD